MIDVDVAGINVHRTLGFPLAQPLFPEPRAEGDYVDGTEVLPPLVMTSSIGLNRAFSSRP